jgi:hypothetical protein
MANSTRTLLLLTTLWAWVSSALAQAPTINDQIVKFCKDHLGEKVGDGECTFLAQAALKHAGAKPCTTFKDFPNKGDYVWGELVYALERKDHSQKETKVPERSIQAGDVIQFRDATFKGKHLRGLQNYEATYPHHTAVVVAVKKDTDVITVLEQNVYGIKKVMENPYRLSDLKTGWVRIYRPVAE